MAGINSNYPSYGNYSRPWERLNGTPFESTGKKPPGTTQLNDAESDYNASGADNSSSVRPQQTYGESRLSVKAQSYLNTLRDKLGDFDVFVADSDDDHKRILGDSSKEFSVIFTSDELEKMANDPDYAKEQLDKLQTIVDMSKKISEQFGFEPAFGESVNKQGDILKSLTMSTDKDGNLQFFAELEKISGKQRERIEESRENKLKEKADEVKHDPEKYKSVTVSAADEEDLIKKINGIDWSKIPEKVRDPKPAIEYRV